MSEMSEIAKVAAELAAMNNKLHTFSLETTAAFNGFTQQLVEHRASVDKKLEAVTGFVKGMQGSIDHLSRAVQQLKTAAGCRANLEMRMNTLFVAGIPMAGQHVNRETAKAAIKRLLAESGVPISSTAEDGKLGPFSLLSFGANSKRPGTGNVTFRVQTTDERYLILNKQVISNLKAKGAVIGVDLTPSEQQNRKQLWADGRFKAAHTKAVELRQEKGPQACTMRWELDRCILGTGSGREVREWSVEYLQQLNNLQHVAAGNAFINLAAGN